MKFRGYLNSVATISIIILLISILITYGMSNLIFHQESDPPQESAPVEPEILVVVRYATEEEERQKDDEVINALAQTVWGEARGCSITEQAAVVWCILNRVDSQEFPDDPLSVVWQENQFDGYDPSYPIEQEFVDLVNDVIGRWELEKTAVGNVGRVLPKDFTFFHGNGKENVFRNAYIGGNTWDWSLDSPYQER